MEYLSNPNQSRHQVKFFYWMLQGPGITSKVPGGPEGPISGLCVHAGLHKLTNTLLLTYCPSTNHITPGLFCLNFKFKGLGKMTSKNLWIYTEFLDHRRTALEGEKWNCSTHFSRFSKLCSKWGLAYLLSFYTQMLQKNELGQSLNLGYLYMWHRIVATMKWCGSSSHPTYQSREAQAEMCNHSPAKRLRTLGKAMAGLQKFMWETNLEGFWISFQGLCHGLRRPWMSTSPYAR